MDKDLKRVAVTGLGVVAAIGNDPAGFGRALFSGRCGIGPVDVFDTSGFSGQQAAQVRGIDLEGPVDYDPRPERVSRCDRLGMLAAAQAVADAGLGRDRETAVVMGGGAGGILAWEKYRRRQLVSRAGPGVLLSCTCSSLADRIALAYGFTGLRSTVSTACSSSSTAIGIGFDLVAAGEHDTVVTGGAEALSELTFAGFNALKVVDPGCCRPFDKNRRGLSLGEGAAVLVLENMEQARRRGARIYAEVLGYATCADAYHMTSPDPQARGMARAMELALEHSGIPAGQVDYVNTHGTGTRANDALETAAIKQVFGPRAALLAVSSTKSMVGHCLGAAGAIEALATVLALDRQVVPPTVNLEQPDPECDLDYVPGRSRKKTMQIAISNSFAFGGNNTCLVLAKAGDA